MKVEQLTIHRVRVLMSCGCQVFSEFQDARCLNPLKSRRA